jgi:hypothetical protein
MADEELTREKAGKNSKFDPSTVPNAETNFSPRRSSRDVVPNRKFKDMEVDFTTFPVSMSSFFCFDATFFCNFGGISLSGHTRKTRLVD